jgi:hypothetical protein
LSRRTPRSDSSRATSFDACPGLAPRRAAARAKLPVSITATKAPTLFAEARAGLPATTAKPSPRVPTPGSARADFQAAIELLLAAVPDLERLTVTVDEDGEAMVDYEKRVVQTLKGAFAVKGGAK